MTPLEHIMGLMDPGYSEPIRRSMAQGILDKHAHELAEQIRTEKGSGTYEPGVYFRTGMDYAADLIDPKAQRANTEGDKP